MTPKSSNPEQAKPEQYVLFIELQGGGAAETLRPLLALLSKQAGFGGGELLTSPGQPGLALVQARFAGEPPGVSIPAGARSWAFAVAEAVPAPTLAGGGHALGEKALE